MTFGVGLIPRIVNIIFAIPIFSIIGKKINQSLVSDADQEIPTIGSTDNAENSVNLISGIIRFPLGLVYLCLNQRPMIDSICLKLFYPS